MEEAIVSPKDWVEYSCKLKGLRLLDIKVNEIVILPIGRSLTEKLKRLSSAILETNWIYDPDSWPLYNGKVNDIHISILRPGFGAPATTVLLEELIACGARKILFLGAAGSLNQNVKIGDIVIPAESICDDGVSKQYYPNIEVIDGDQELISAVEKACNKLGISYHKGLIWTISTPYRETPSKVVEMQKKGCLAVDMEVSAIFSVAKFRNAKAAAILSISDELWDLRWKPAFHTYEFRKAEEKLINIALETTKYLF